ncbi:hypothetical protein [Winogradskyella sp.]|uniref:hypothetical protein n=1 Tax=Winogradskyella sp. TaxID=1883156 RepID=UPI003F6C3D08
MKLNNYLLIYFCLFLSYSYSQTERDIINRIDSINSIALRHYQNDDIVNAFNFYNESSRLSDSIKDNYGSSVANFNLGKIYTHMQDCNNAEESYIDMLQKAIAIDDNYLIANSYLSLGKMYRNEKTIEEVIPYYKKALKFALKDDVSDQNNIDKSNQVLFDVRLSLADVYIETKQLNEALTYLLKAQNNIENMFWS